eukprot:GHRR01027621.1.p2 GENE.GHRR01027621.1~~GHRR01027621.1.p2  ORF type:complete len:105 (-),score=12.78 GHRR01027621.1:709-1023(-)
MQPQASFTPIASIPDPLAMVYDCAALQGAGSKQPRHSHRGFGLPNAIRRVCCQGVSELLNRGMSTNDTTNEMLQCSAVIQTHFKNASIDCDKPYTMYGITQPHD